MVYVMRYEEMSDDEINAQVTIIEQGPDVLTLVDYCNNPSDAWPIILENKISIIAPENGIKGWEALSLDCLSEHEVNPLRAAMIVFLMMKDEASA